MILYITYHLYIYTCCTSGSCGGCGRGAFIFVQCKKCIQKTSNVCCLSGSCGGCGRGACVLCGTRKQAIRCCLFNVMWFYMHHLASHMPLA